MVCNLYSVRQKSYLAPHRPDGILICRVEECNSFVDASASCVQYAQAAFAHQSLNKRLGSTMFRI